MTLSEFALLVDADPKWVLNTRAVIGGAKGYTIAAAERLALVRVLNRDFGLALPRAWELSGEFVATNPSSGTHRIESPDGTVALDVDLARVRAAMSTRRSQLVTMHEPRRAGRKAKRSGNALRSAVAYGLDLSLLQANLARPPVDRLRQLDAMGAFRANVRRKMDP